MRIGKTAALVLISVLASACGHEPHAEHTQTHGDSSLEPAGQVQGLQLNEGERWEMDDHTRSMFQVMVARVEGWEGDDADSRSLGEALEADLDALIQGCTMTGDAHAELHKFLMTLMPAVDALAQGGEREVRTVAEVLASYPQYFD